MGTNAPYYQLRGQFTSGTNAQLSASDDDGDEDVDYDLVASLAPHNATLYADSQMPDIQVNTLDENHHHFVELLEAATTAAGQAAETTNIEDTGSNKHVQSRKTRKRVSDSPDDDASCGVAAIGHGNVLSSLKRAKIDVPTDPQLQQPRSSKEIALEHTSVPPSGETLLNGARAAGVHSATALFRQSSKENTRKYTRPPMSKLFMSLQLTPENFLHLQAQAKAYMLDPVHPERQSCVGNRGKGDTDLVKLRLFKCVHNFLSDGVGEQYFGEDAEKPAEDDSIEVARALGQERARAEVKLVWPRDGNKIISLVTPLLRRMVTNERQRVYAIETRKDAAKKKEGSAEAALSLSNSDTFAVGMSGRGLNEQSQPGIHGSIAVSERQNSFQPLEGLPTALNSSETMHHAMQHFTPKTTSLSLPLDPLAKFSDLLNITSMYHKHILPPKQTFSLRRVDIFLAKGGINLRVRRRILDVPNLSGFHELEWDEVKAQAASLIRQAMVSSPELQEAQVPRDMGPEALRGLAVAATEVQHSSASSNGVSGDANPESAVLRSYATSPPVSASSCPSVDIPEQHSDPSASLVLNANACVLPLPDHVIKIMLTNGLTQIQDSAAWKRAIGDIGMSVWADGIMTVVVDLV